MKHLNPFGIFIQKIKKQTGFMQIFFQDWHLSDILTFLIIKKAKQPYA